ncbi:phage major capsid protein [Bacillus thuringiensis]|uniref:phage major capsid protein n=1 Tax=Bacillus thuringiensis TaxID=1428 RepID=UPI00159BE8C5|nr:phage major capsid protein [Bacillus thuringiensis]MED3681824.1 phage major capsid protein [Bacillus thuringiensis]
MNNIITSNLSTNAKDVTISFMASSENSPLIASKFDMFKHVGKTDRLFAMDDKEADIEPDELISKDVEFESVTFDQKTVSTSVDITQLILNKTPIDLTNIAQGKATRRILRTLQSQAFGKGNADGSGNQMQSIFEYNNYTNKIADIKTYAKVDEMFNDFANSSENLQGAIFVVDNALFATKLLDEGKQTLLKSSDANDGSIGKIYNIPVFVQPMNGKGKMVLMNPKAYAVSVNNELTAEVNDGSEDSDTTLKGYTFVYAEIMASGMVANPHGIKILTDLTMSAQSVEKPKAKSSRKVKGE